MRIGVVVTAVLVAHGTASAQEPLAEGVVLAPRVAEVSTQADYDNPSLLAETAKRVALDPTTYVPAALSYTATRLDWDSSQPLFRLGYVEAHSGFTRTGLANDIPVGYDEGNRRIRNQALAQFGRSLANNAACAVIERALIARAPRHRRLIRTLGWIERTAFASYFSYILSVRHFEQWRANEALARQVGAR